MVVSHLSVGSLSAAHPLTFLHLLAGLLSTAEAASAANAKSSAACGMSQASPRDRCAADATLCLSTRA